MFVDRIYKADPKSPFSEKRIEKLTVREPEGKKESSPTKAGGKQKDMDVRMKIIRRAAKEVKDGMNVNLGIGIPTLLPSVLAPDVKINLQS